MPNFSAVSRSLSSPTLSASSPKAVLHDRANASISGAAIRTEAFVTVVVREDAISKDARRAGRGLSGRARILYGVLGEVESRLLGAIGKAVSAANAKIARSEQVRRFVLLLADLSETNGNVTPTMKLKRGAFTERARHIVDNLYADQRTQA